MTQPVGGAAPAPLGVPGVTGTPATGRTPGNDQLDKDAFLKLLVAQLRYQDPTSPLDSAQFMAQTAQFTAVEKLTDLAASQATLLNAQAFLQATATVGRTVTWTGADGIPQSGVVSAAQFTSSGPELVVDGSSTPVPLSAVTAVALPSTPAGTAVGSDSPPASEPAPATDSPPASGSAPATDPAIPQE